MKRSLSLFLASLMLVFALTACGRSNNTTQDNGQNGTQSESAVTGSDSAGSSNTGNGNGSSNGDANGNGSLLDDAGNAVEDGLNGMENAMDDMTGDTARHRAGGTMSR